MHWRTFSLLLLQYENVKRATATDTESIYFYVIKDQLTGFSSVQSWMFGVDGCWDVACYTESWLLKCHRNWQAHLTGTVTPLSLSHAPTHRACTRSLNECSSHCVPCSFASSHDLNLCSYPPLIFDVNRRINTSALRCRVKRLPWQRWDWVRQYSGTFCRHRVHDYSSPIPANERQLQ